MTGLRYDAGDQASLVSRLRAELDEALVLLKEFQQIDDVPVPVSGDVLPPNLLEQCLVLCEAHSSTQPEPIRTVHHFACTGGTLISKCIASMPNTQLLSEIDPLSMAQQSPSKPRFAPTDMITLMRQSTRGATPELIMKLFLSNLEVIHSESICSGLRLVLRDHAHSHYCRDEPSPDRPSLRSLVASRFPVLSLVTVRDPIDSYLSLKANGWLHFIPATFDEYCRRYIDFIHAHDGIPVVHYENFVAHPKIEMEKICRILDLPFNPEFCDLFDVYRITGDSGRSGRSIEARSRQSDAAGLVDEMSSSTVYQQLRSLMYVASSESK